MLQNSFLPFVITEWNKLDTDNKNIDFLSTFRKKLLTCIRPLEEDAYEIYGPLRVRLLNTLVWVSGI